MQNEIKIFNNPQFGEIRTVELNGEIWFVGKDVAEVLGYKSPSVAICENIEPEDKTTFGISESGSNYKSKVTLINESGLYSLIIRSNLPQAKVFKHWVTSEVLPSIRKHGAYMTDMTINSLIENPDLVIQLANTLKKERLEKMQACQQVQEQKNLISQQQGEIKELTTTVQALTDENQIMSKKVSYLDIILASKKSVNITQIAQDYGMTPIKFNRLLHDEHIQHCVNKQWILYREYLDKGYVTSETFPFRTKDGTLLFKLNTKWTQKGRAFLYQFLKTKGILPTIER